MPTVVFTRKESWFRKLKDGRLEVNLVGVIQGDASLPIKVRASGPENAIWQTVDFFEEVTGMSVEAEWRRPPRTGPRPLRGQITIEEVLDAGPIPLP